MIQPDGQRADTNRRLFLKFAGAAAASALAGRSGAAAARPSFEVSASLYAWDLHDEGIEKILDNLQSMAAVNSVYLIALMHYEKRPLTSPVFTHNPVRQTWQAEDSRIYWLPDMKRYGRIKPRLSDYDWLNKTDWLTQMVQAVRKRGLNTGVELSHTVLDLERGKTEFIDCVQRDINGEPRAVFGRGYPICLNNPDARQYVLNLFSELAARYDVDYLQTCTLPFMPGGPEKGGCFCDSCVRAAKADGFDLAKAKLVLKQNPKAQPELDQWQTFRQKSVARYYKFMHDGIHAIRPKADLRFNDCFSNNLDWGLNLALLKPHLDSVRVCDYTEQRGNPALMKDKREWLTRDRQALGKDFPIVSAIAVRPKATLELIREGVRIAVECGMNGITLGHYDGAEFPMLRAIREGMAEAKV
jgi:hypothetical protein